MSAKGKRMNEKKNKKRPITFLLRENNGFCAEEDESSWREVADNVIRFDHPTFASEKY